MVKDKITDQKNECEDHYVDEEPACNKTMDTPAEEHDAYDAAGQYFADEYDADVRFAIHDIREDLGRHLNLSSDRQNAMITIVGILLAFASLLFINMYPEDGFFTEYQELRGRIRDIHGRMLRRRHNNSALLEGRQAHGWQHIRCDRSF